jgi:hypothetical protein
MKNYMISGMNLFLFDDGKSPRKKRETALLHVPYDAVSVIFFFLG